MVWSGLGRAAASATGAQGPGAHSETADPVTRDPLQGAHSSDLPPLSCFPLTGYLREKLALHLF